MKSPGTGLIWVMGIISRGAIMVHVGPNLIVKLLEEYESGGVVGEAWQCIRDLALGCHFLTMRW